MFHMSVSGSFVAGNLVVKVSEWRFGFKRIGMSVTQENNKSLGLCSCAIGEQECQVHGVVRRKPETSHFLAFTNLLGHYCILRHAKALMNFSHSVEFLTEYNTILTH
ncbi:hypothetical protein XENOCAPTIV_010130 [Xenoophorus captivus]|uniref:Uncharacterized protein n=1 Tax=Xenoophorus captivus TaxID=1517983 RepID=A0ABV0R9S0_9TELE